MQRATEQRVRVIGRHYHRGRMARGRVISLRPDQVSNLRQLGKVLLMPTPPRQVIQIARAKRPRPSAAQRPAINTDDPEPEPAGAGL